MKETLKNVLDLDNPVLTEKLAPKLAPFAKIIYFAGLVLMALRLVEAIMYGASFSILLLNLLMVVAEFAILRMFCEYLAASAPKSSKK